MTPEYKIGDLISRSNSNPKRFALIVGKPQVEAHIIQAQVFLLDDQQISAVWIASRIGRKDQELVPWFKYWDKVDV